MRASRATKFLCAGLLVLTACNPSQITKSEATSSQADTLPFISKRKFNHTKEITTTYDRFKGETTVELTLEKVNSYKSEGHFYFIGFSFTYPEQTVITPKDVLLTVSSFSDEKRFSERDTLDVIILADGQRFILGKMNLSKTENLKLIYQETLTLAIPYASYIKIASSNDVEMRLGETEFSLTQEQIEALRDLGSRMMP